MPTTNETKSERGRGSAIAMESGDGVPQFGRQWLRPESLAVAGIRSKPLKGVGRLLPRPGNATLADRGGVMLRQLVELLVQQRGSDLNEAVRTVSTPTHVLALAHTAPDDPVDRGLNKAG